ncbi:polyphosphate kinase 1 [Morganella morganii]
MSQDRLYMEKELSWLSFNERVLQEAADKRNPLIERMRFLGIYSNNLDEFYKVRYADVKRRILINEEQRGSGASGRHLLRKIENKVAKQDQAFDTLYNDLLLEMARNQIFLINERQISPKQQIWLRQYFRQHLRQHITPIMIQTSTDLVEFLKDDYTYLVVEIVKSGRETRYALLEIPSDKVPRFVNLPTENGRRRQSMILIDNILRYCLDEIFKGFFDFDALNAYSMKMTRDAEYDLATEMESGMLEMMSSTLKQRLTAEPVRFVYQRDMPDEMVTLLREKLGLTNDDSVIAGGRYHNFKDFIRFPNEGNKNLLNKPLPRLRHIWFDHHRNGFDAIRERDVLLYYPYHTFEHVLELLRQASFDPSVISIKMNIYRVAKDSRIIDSMIHAAHNGKKVTVVVELQARFDEEANIHWARHLTAAGVHVIFSAPGLKIHAKLFIISRLEDGDVIRRYAHIGTGNFNEKTARIYTDYSLLTANEEITNEVRRVFNFIENPYRPVTFDNLMVSPQNSRAMLNQLIDDEIANALAGYDAGITLKINNLVDKQLSERLYDASEAGVKIRLLVRGMCALVPGQVPYSENIQVTSIVDRFLEHDRVYVFTNKGDEKVYLSSADWMTRNIDYRIEVAVRLLDPVLRRRVLDILDIQFSDNEKARYLDKEMSNHYVPRGNKRKVRSQMAVYDYIRSLEQPDN